MKAIKLLLLIAVFALSACDKEPTGQCSICEVETIIDGVSLSTDMEQTARQGEASGACTLSQGEYRQLLVAEQTELDSVYTDIGINYEFTVKCRLE